MRVQLKLFRVTIEFETDTKTIHAAAMTEHQGAMMVIDWAEGQDTRQKRFSIARIDETLPADQRRGLGVLLDGLPGLASYQEDCGWVLDQVLGGHTTPPLDLFRIVTLEGQETFVVAGEDHEAVAIWMDAEPLGDDESSMFKVMRAVNDLPEEQWAGVDDMLAQGPAGIATWSAELGWKVTPAT